MLLLERKMSDLGKIFIKCFVHIRMYLTQEAHTFFLSLSLFLAFYVLGFSSEFFFFITAPPNFPFSSIKRVPSPLLSRTYKWFAEVAQPELQFFAAPK